MSGLEELVKEPPPELYREAEDFIRFLVERRARKTKGELKLDWIGALQDMKDQYTSVELQHEILNWWEEKEDVPP